MPYATAQQLAQQYGVEEISQLVSDEESLVSEQMLSDALAGNSLTGYTTDEQAAIARAMNRINQVLAMQSNFMDSRLALRYALPLPFTTDQVNASPLLECCLALSRAALSDDDENMTTLVEKERDYWRDWLSDIAKAKAIIPGLVITQSQDGVVNRHITGQAKTRVDWCEFHEDAFTRRYV
jgi:phage gp36-like protein